MPCFAQSPLDDKVLETEKQRFAAQVSRDFSVVDKILSDDLVYIHSSGNTDTKASYMKMLSDNKAYDDIVVEKSKVRVYHKNTGIINGECTYYRTGADGKPNNLQLRYTAVYVLKKKQWQLVSWQSFKRN